MLQGSVAGFLRVHVLRVIWFVSYLNLFPRGVRLTSNLISWGLQGPRQRRDILPLTASALAHAVVLGWFCCIKALSRSLLKHPYPALSSLKQIIWECSPRMLQLSQCLGLGWGRGLVSHWWHKPSSLSPHYCLPGAAISRQQVAGVRSSYCTQVFQCGTWAS